jgi:hypothetical protein
MTKADEFREYAEETLRWAYQAKTAETKKAFLNLSRTWMEAALESERIAAAATCSVIRRRAYHSAVLMGSPSS